MMKAMKLALLNGEYASRCDNVSFVAIQVLKTDVLVILFLPLWSKQLVRKSNSNQLILDGQNEEVHGILLPDKVQEPHNFSISVLLDIWNDQKHQNSPKLSVLQSLL